MFVVARMGGRRRDMGENLLVPDLESHARIYLLTTAPKPPLPKIAAVCGEYTPAGVLFRLARRPAPQPEGRGFVVVGVGEGARGALGHRGTTSPGQGLVDAMPERSPPAGGEATLPITGRWDHGW